MEEKESWRASVSRRKLREEENMRTMALTLAAAASIVGAVSLASNRAEATIPGSSAAIRQATEDTSLAHPANYVCRWSYWGRRCWWRHSYYHSYYGYHRPYYGYYGYHRPYYPGDNQDEDED
jgi:hypothetical protein